MKDTRIGFLPAISIVMANMVGVGVFTSLGFQLNDLSDYRSVIAIWVVGGVLALFGSFCYSELSSAYPQSGGEYHFLRLAFGNLTGFLSGWTSAVVGFAAPIAAAAHAFAVYFGNVLPWDAPPILLSSGLIIGITAIHATSLRVGARFQVYFTTGKVLLMVVFVAYGLLINWNDQPMTTAGGAVLHSNVFMEELMGSGFWVGLIFVSYAYSGWNASAYMIDEIRDPVKNVPRSILIGTIIVMLLYASINYVFMTAAPADVLRGRHDVANIAAQYLFGPAGASLISGLISFFLISTISSMIIVGPRVIRRIAQDYPTLSYFSANQDGSVPVRAIILQSGLALIFLFTSSFETIITGIGFILTIFTTLTAVALIWLRIREPQVERPVKTPIYPIVPVAYILFNIWILYHVTADKLKYLFAGILFLSLGVISHFIMRRKGAAIFLILIPFAAHTYPTAASVFELPKICACT